MIVYKVCSVSNYLPIKMMSYLEWCPHTREYKIGEISKRQSDCGPMAAFSTLDCARKIDHTSSKLIIIKCNAKISSCKNLYHEQYCNIRKFPLEEILHYYPGTVLCDTITPLEVVA